MSTGDAPSAYFVRTDAGYMPTPAAFSPWNESDLSGVAIGGLLAHLIDQAVAGEAMTVARLAIDILGNAPAAEMIARTRILRDGKRLRMIEAELLAGDRAVARATALLVRQVETIASETPLAHPLPDNFASAPQSSRSALHGAMDRRVVFGDFRQSGPGAMWVRFVFDLVEGVPMSPLVRAAMLGDMGSAIGSAFSVRDWTFANVDISLHFTRQPESDWVLIEAHTEGAGNGLAMVTSRFSDLRGVYAHGHQALFLAARKG